MSMSLQKKISSILGKIRSQNVPMKTDVVQYMAYGFSNVFVCVSQSTITISKQLRKTATLQRMILMICQTTTRGICYTGGMQQMYFLSVERVSEGNCLSVWSMQLEKRTPIQKACHTKDTVIKRRISSTLV